MQGLQGDKDFLMLEALLRLAMLDRIGETR
jgi:hypothetical protein